MCYFVFVSFFVHETPTTELYTYSHTLSLHVALPIYRCRRPSRPRHPALSFFSRPRRSGHGLRLHARRQRPPPFDRRRAGRGAAVALHPPEDRKSTRLNSSH